MKEEPKMIEIKNWLVYFLEVSAPKASESGFVGSSGRSCHPFGIDPSSSRAKYEPIIAKIWSKKSKCFGPKKKKKSIYIYIYILGRRKQRKERKARIENHKKQSMHELYNTYLERREELLHPQHLWAKNNFVWRTALVGDKTCSVGTEGIVNGYRIHTILIPSTFRIV